MKTFLGLIVCCTFIAGCSGYTPPMQYDIVNVREYEMNFDDTWSRTVQWFALSGNPVQTMDKGSGFIATEFSIDPNDTTLCDCGKGGFIYAVLAASHSEIVDTYVTWNVYVQKITEERTKVTVTARFSGILEERVTGGDETNIETQRVACNSKGVLEKQILDAIEYGM